MTKYSDWPHWLQMLVLVPHGLLASVMCWLLVAEVGERVDAFWVAGRISHFVFFDHALRVRNVK